MSLRAPLTLTACLLSTTPVFAQAPSVAIVAAASTGLSDCRFTDVQSYLMATGSFASVDVVDCTSRRPLLADLTPYDAVITWSNVAYFDSDALGDVMADYTDTGGGVVVAVFANTSTSADLSLGGRWSTGGYEVIEATLGNAGTTASLGTIIDPTSSLMQGVSTLTASSAFRPLLSTGLVQGNVVAEWDDGSILAAQGTMPNRVDLGMYPPSNNCFSFFWDFTGDGATLVANALLAVSGNAGVPGMSYCTPVANSTGVPGAILASGSAVAADNNVMLTASRIPNNSFGFFLVSQMQGFTPMPGGSAGNLCLRGSIGRYVGAGQIGQASAAGRFSLTLDLTMTPQPNGFVSIAAGETWNYQAWYRDAVGGMATSNFTDGYTIVFE